jgi:hypothetical protein
MKALVEKRRRTDDRLHDNNERKRLRDIRISRDEREASTILMIDSCSSYAPLSPQACPHRYLSIYSLGRGVTPRGKRAYRGTMRDRSAPLLLTALTVASVIRCIVELQSRLELRRQTSRQPGRPVRPLVHLAALSEPERPPPPADEDPSRGNDQRPPEDSAMLPHRSQRRKRAAPDSQPPPPPAEDSHDSHGGNGDSHGGNGGDSGGDNDGLLRTRPFPVVLLTANRGAVLNRTLASLLAVRSLDASTPHPPPATPRVQAAILCVAGAWPRRLAALRRPGRRRTFGGGGGTLARGAGRAAAAGAAPIGARRRVASQLANGSGQPAAARPGGGARLQVGAQPRLRCANRRRSRGGR